MAIRDKGKTLPKVDPNEVAKALGAEPAPPKVLKIRMSKQVKLFLQTLPSDEQRALLDHFEKIARGEVPLEMSPEERAIFESEAPDLEAALEEAQREDDEASEN
jgi:hypothetical protein